MLMVCCCCCCCFCLFVCLFVCLFFFYFLLLCTCVKQLQQLLLLMLLLLQQNTTTTTTTILQCRTLSVSHVKAQQLYHIESLHPPQHLITAAVLKQEIKDIVILQYLKIQTFDPHKCLQSFEVFGAFPKVSSGGMNYYFCLP